MHQEVSRSI